MSSVFSTPVDALKVKPIERGPKKERKEVSSFLFLFSNYGAMMKKKMSPGVLLTAFALSLFMSMSLKHLKAQDLRAHLFIHKEFHSVRQSPGQF